MAATRIFPISQPLAQLISEREALNVQRRQKNPEHAHLYRDASLIYTQIYERALTALSSHGMLPVAQAATRMNLTSEALLRKADRGQLVLFEIEGMQIVPDWVLDRQGRVKPFQLAIAREFAASGQQEFFKFMSYLKFMGEQTLEFQTALPKASLKEVFRAVGIKQGSCRVLVRTPMFEAADRAAKNRVLMAEFINQLGAALTRIAGMGGPNEGGISAEFLARYVPLDLPGRDRWKIDLNN